jgi:hypothetical protein
MSVLHLISDTGADIANRRFVPVGGMTHTPGQRSLHGNIHLPQSFDTALEVTWIFIWQDVPLPFD